MAEFMYPNLTHKVLSLSNAELLNAPFSRNPIPKRDKGLLHAVTVHEICWIDST
jgi:hypothetical protein